MRRGVPLLVEAERPREGLGDLLERATFVATSASFPGSALSGEAGTLKRGHGGSGGSRSEEGGCSSPPHPGAAAAWLLASLPENVRWVSTTLGAKGAFLLERRKNDSSPAEPAEDAASAVDAALSLAEEARRRIGKESRFAARSSTGAEVGLPGVVSFAKKLKLPRRASSSSSHSEIDAISVTLYASTAASLPGSVVDSTGAGDAFNGALIHALSREMGLEKTLALACSVAGCNCLGLGARGGLPRSPESVSGELLW